MLSLSSQPIIPYPNLLNFQKSHIQPSNYLISPVFSSIEGSNLIKDAYHEFRRIFASKLPKSDNKLNFHRYIRNIISNEQNMDLKDKYICSIYISWNKNLLTKEIINDIINNNFHVILLDWVSKESYVIYDYCENENKNNVKFNIFMGLLINTISLFETFNIKSSDLSEYYFYDIFFNLNENIKLNVKQNYPFLESLENLIKKWKKQIDCFNISKTIQKFQTFLGKKTKATNVGAKKCLRKKKKNGNKNKKDKEPETEDNSGENNNEIEITD